MSKESLVQGGPLIVEDLDLSGIGMYTDEQKAKLLSEGVPEGDFFLKTLMRTTMWARKSDEGKKWHVFTDSEIKLHKDLKK
jgi:hypothetical protein